MAAAREHFDAAPVPYSGTPSTRLVGSCNIMDPCETPTVIGRAGGVEMHFHKLTRGDDVAATLDGTTKGFQRVKLPPGAAATMPDLLRKWQREADLSSDASGPVTMGLKAHELQEAASRAFKEATSAAVLSNMPERVMSTWDNQDTLRIFVAMIGGGFLIRQSAILSKGETAGSATADGIHTDACLIDIEQRLKREAGARLGCSPDESLVVSVVNMVSGSVRELGVAAEDYSNAELARLIEQGTLAAMRMWMSPNSAAKPLAFLDAATVDYNRYRADDSPLHVFEPAEVAGSFGVDYSKMHPLSSYPKDKKFGQIQLSYVPSPGHQWYYFHDLAEDEAIIFTGLESTFHVAFEPIIQTATEERVSAETTLLTLAVQTKEPQSVEQCARFLSAVRREDGKFVFCTAAGERDVSAARAFINSVALRNRHRL